jgi:hypothetical protein
MKTDCQNKQRHIDEMYMARSLAAGKYLIRAVPTNRPIMNPIKAINK